MNAFSLPSYAKVNLYLRIIGLLPDGYHSLEMVNSRISLHDTIHIDLDGESGVRLTVSDPDIPADSRNTVYQAAQRFLDRTGILNGVSIHIEKRIPSGAGLGGGSSNAGVVLVALNDRFERPLTREELCAMASKIGADVPFFLDGQCARVAGIGEEVTPVPVHPFLRENAPYLTLCSPGVHVATKEAYALWDRKGISSGMPPSRLLESIFRGEGKNLASGMYNSFEEVIYPAYPPLEEVYMAFCDCSPTQPMLSGSGSNLFSLHDSQEEAETTTKKMERKGYRAQVCRLLL